MVVLSANPTPLISIIIPLYNAETTIQRTVESILAQSYGNYEVLLVDDGSSDSTPEVCAAICCGDSRFKYLRKENSGVSSTRNVGIANATGIYLCFVDGDDELETESLELLVKAAVSSRADMVIGGSSFDLYEGSSLVRSQRRCVDSDALIKHAELSTVFEEMYERSYVQPSWGKLILAALVKDNGIAFNPKLTNFEDLVFVIACLEASRSVYLCNLVVYRYRVSGTESGSKRYRSDIMEQMLEVSKSLVGLYKGFSNSDKCVEKCLQKVFVYFIFAISNLCRGRDKTPFQKASVIRDYAGVPPFSDAIQAVRSFSNTYGRIQMILLSKRLWMLSLGLASVRNAVRNGR